MEEIEKYRNEIDIIDLKIIKLVEKRTDIAMKIGKIKKINHLKLFQPQREKEIIEALQAKSKILDPSSIEAIWKEIIKCCRIVQG